MSEKVVGKIGKRMEYVEVAEFKREGFSPVILAVGVSSGKVAIRDTEGEWHQADPMELVVALVEYRNKVYSVADTSKTVN